MDTLQLLGLSLGTAFAAGLNVYATVAVLGAAQYFHLFSLPVGLGVLGHPVVIFGAAVLFFIEFFADKVPYVDTVWDGIHTLIRPATAAALSFGIFSGMPEAWKVVAALVGGSVALTSHGAKATTRAAANTSPEPFSNWILSVLEDALAVGITTLAMTHPVIAGAVVLVLLVLAVLVIRRVVRFFRRAFSTEPAVEPAVTPTVPGAGS
jgi:hypothetical protein